MALPSADPSCRNVDVIAEARPDLSGGTSSSTTDVSWADARPSPIPYTKSGPMSHHGERVGASTIAVPRMPTISNAIPTLTTLVGPSRAARCRAIPPLTRAPRASPVKMIPVFKGL